jgi:hypothetical protein
MSAIQARTRRRSSRSFAGATILHVAHEQRPRDDRLEEAVTGTDADASPRSVSPARGTVVAAAWG